MPALPTVVETSVFARKAAKLLTAEEYADLIFYLARYHQAGDEIPGTGGVRKLRYAVQGRGKSGGVRVIYYFFDDVNPILALFLYGKNEQGNLTPAEKKLATSLAAAMKLEAKARRNKR
ncbi:MAG TPA: type II toxin-antitoxin system RelE/ParE family toxin [Terracidiphilus sp.]|nr:type II toxin-antitoxin system RelE/ParE family toxin [Terracidiphilus sp.]